MMWPIVTIALDGEDDVVAIRQHSRRIAELLGFDRQDATRIATAVSEIARNAHAYAGGGRAGFLVDGSASPQALHVRIVDRGAGIADVGAVIDGTATGFGIRSARRLVDSFTIDSTPGHGTTVTLVKVLPRTAPPVTRDRINGLAEAAGAQRYNPLALLKDQNRELVDSLDALRVRQDEMSRLNLELEDTNRGVVALYAELEDKADQLRQASELKSRFLSNMSHEFRTPLNSILALSRLLLDRTDGDLGEEQEKQILLIRKSAAQLTEMINDLLDIAKVESGKLDINVTAFTVEELFGGLRGVLRPLLTGDAVDLVFEEPPPGLPALRTDEAKLAQILRNFVSNALKFTERGEVRVFARHEPETGRVAFSVRDTGIGIGAEHHERIFEEFTQVQNRFQKAVKGTGLGLPLSRKLAELLGGEVRLDSEPGRGSTFTVAIPAVFGADASPPSRPGTDGEGGRGRVLVIDDEEAFRYVFGHLIGGFRHEVVQAQTGEDGLRSAVDLRPDVIFLDLHMPGIDGFTVLSRLKADPVTRHIPVVVVTSSVIGPADEALLVDAVAVLPKSTISRETVTDVLRLAGLGERR